MKEMGSYRATELGRDDSGVLLSEIERLRRENEECKRLLAVQNERLVDLSLKVSKEIVIVYALLEFNKAIFGTQEAAVLYGSTLTLLDRAFGLKHVCLFAGSADDEHLVLRASSVATLAALADQRLSVLPGFAKTAIAQGTAGLVEGADALADGFCDRFLPEMGTVAYAPAMVRGHFCGLIAAFETSPGSFTDQHVHVLSSVVASVAIAAENCELHEHLQQQAVTDELTGLTNRRVLNQKLSVELKRSVRQRSALSVLMIDIDRFKRFNDTYGHHMGDTILRELAALLLAQLRCDDICARFGGEEFVVVLPGVEERGAHATAERIRAAVEQLSIPTSDGKTNCRVTVSIGVSTYGEPLVDWMELVDRADRAMYQAKTLGRNQVCAA